MIHTIKRYTALFVLVSLVGAVPVFAVSGKTNPARKNETVVVDIQGKKINPLISKVIGRKESHKYQFNLQPGERAVFRLRADRQVALKIEAAGGVKEVRDGKYYEGTLSAPGDYSIEVTTDNISLYTLEISGK